ncbi:MAG: hypothetical protein DHS20C18_46790 [Saprospiraceae bacterium]|nr:MAG: hypothetical protein DHS20C18_46790 [Saprospiraceae bacterium]
MKMVKFLLPLILFSGLALPGKAQLVDQLIPIHQNRSGQVAAGYIFITPSTLSSPGDYPSSLCILDSIGNPVFFKPFTDQTSGPYPSAQVTDFKLQPSGLLSYATRLASGAMGMYFLDNTFSIVDSIQSMNGFSTDSHDLIHLPDGSYHLVGYENRTLDLSQLTTLDGTQGSETANVLGNVLQRFDAQKNLEFEWKTLDHFAMEDSYQHAFTQPAYLDHAHYNSLEIDDDGNYLLSFRHLHEITKINAQTGEVIWHLGGKNNQFSFLGDTMQFSTQHDARRIDNGNLTLFDNGAYNSVPIARGIEYQLDEINMTATAVWQFGEPNGLPSLFIGNTTRLNNGNTLINWGGAFPLAETTSFTEVDAFGNIVLELDLIPDTYISYRAVKQELPFSIPRPEIGCDGENSTLSAPEGYASYEWNTGATTQNITVSDTGTYQVWVNLGIGFVSSIPYQVNDLASVCNLTNVMEPEPSQFHLFPNPASEELFVEYAERGMMTAQIITVSGQVIETIELDFYENNKQSRIDISRLPVGLYYLRIGGISRSFIKL